MLSLFAFIKASNKFLESYYIIPTPFPQFFLNHCSYNITKYEGITPASEALKDDRQHFWNVSQSSFKTLYLCGFIANIYIFLILLANLG